MFATVATPFTDTAPSSSKLRAQPTAKTTIMIGGVGGHICGFQERVGNRIHLPRVRETLVPT